MKKAIQTFIFILFACTTSNVFGQLTQLSDSIDSTKIYEVELNDGSVFIGNIIQKDSLNIVLSSSAIPRLVIPISEIKSINKSGESKLKKERYWFTNPHATRYILGSSAFNLKKGEGYYQNRYGFINSLNYGITDHVSIGGGLELLSILYPLTSFRFNPVAFVTPKVGFKLTEKLHAGGGLLYVSIPDESSMRRIGSGATYVVGTYGTIDHHLTGGLGWVFLEGVFYDRPILLTLSGISRITERAALVLESWVIMEEDYVFLYGLRFLGENISIDLAFIKIEDLDLLLGFPSVSFAAKF